MADEGIREMKIEIQDEWIETFSQAVKKHFGWRDGRHRFSKCEVDLFAAPTEMFDMLENEIIKLKPTKETKEALGAFNRCREIFAGKLPRATNALSATHLIKCYLAEHAPGFRLWNESGKQWYGYFVDAVWYEPETKHSREYTPATANLRLEYMNWGRTERYDVNFESQFCRGKTAKQLLGERGFVVETDEIAAAYKKATENHLYFCPKIGMQCHFSGISFGEEDSYQSMKDFDCDSKRKDRSIGGEPTTVVVDVIDDSSEEIKPMQLHSDLAHNYDLSSIKASRSGKPKDEDDFIAADDENAEANELFIPMHPLVPVFDLVRHVRYAVHANDLVEYKYDLTIGDKLILPQKQKDLLAKLVESKGDEFKDIVGGKSGVTVVLLAGRPGLGKTLSAEVFSECSQRPLYRVQCSQLGTDSDTIEGELHVVFRRSRRWNAVVLLDEADLYIGERGMDIQRNAIVCVFLRVLESQDGVLFLTTNLPETVDDAIASRCIARIDVKHPDRPSLRKIWDVLLQVSGFQMALGDVEYFCNKFPKMGGRDVKAAIKLAMVSSAGGKISRDAMEFVLSFHPNRGQWSEQECAS